MTQHSEAETVRARPLSLEDLILLNEELLALLRGGIPLDIGLQGSASRIGGRLGKLVERLAQRIAEGASLEQALARESAAIPGPYRAIVAAGQASGRFDEILTSLSAYARAMRELQSHVRRALIYPFSLLIVAYLLFVMVVVTLFPWVLSVFETFHLGRAWWTTPMEVLQRTVPFWGPALPCLVLLLAVVPWIRDRTSPARQQISSDRKWLLLRWLPGVRGITTAARLARFSHLLSILSECRVPFPQALRLSAASAGDSGFARGIETVATKVEAGQPLSEAIRSSRALPPFLAWLIVVGERQSMLPETLRQAAEVYQQRAMLRSEWLANVLPVLLVLFVGGGVTALYAATLFVPMVRLWEGLGV